MRRVLFNVVPYSGKIEDSRALNNVQQPIPHSMRSIFRTKSEIIQNKLRIVLSMQMNNKDYTKKYKYKTTQDPMA